MSVNIKTSSGLQKLTPEVNKSTISSALGYTPTDDTKINEHASNSDIHVTASDKTKWNNKSDFNGDFNSLSNKPNIIDDGSDSFNITDLAGKIAFQVGPDGTTRVAALEINNQDFATAVNDVVTIPELPEWTDNIYDDEQGNFAIADKSGNIAFEVAADGTTKVAKLMVGPEGATKDIEDIIDERIGEIPELVEIDPTVSSWAKTGYTGDIPEAIGLGDIDIDDSKEFNIADEEGNIAFKVGEDGTVYAKQLALDGLVAEHGELATLGARNIMTETMTVYDQLAVEGNMRIDNVDIQSNSIKLFGQYGAISAPDTNSCLMFYTSGDSGETHSLYVGTSGWQTINAKTTVTVSLKTTPTKSFSQKIYWYCYTLSGGDAKGSKICTFSTTTKSVSFDLTDSQLTTDWLGADYLGFGFTLAEARSMAQTTKEAYKIDNALSDHLLGDIFLATSTGVIGCMGSLVPLSTDYYSLGSATSKWSNIYAVTSSISSSDENQKNTILPLTDQHTQIFDALEPVSYKFNQNTSGRTHTGLIAQNVKAAVESAGLTTKDFAAYCEWKTEDGNTECGLRYEEFIALCINEIQKLKKRVAELESK